LIRIAAVLDAGHWTGPAADTVSLDYDGRHRRRIVFTGASGQYLLDLPEAHHLRHGDGLKLEDGRIVAVGALPEPLHEIRAASPAALLRLAWHIGNRHLAASIQSDCILIRRDHVIAHMLEHLGATVREVDAPFDPEGGAYAAHEH
jgi:urease accessory protein